MAERGNSLKRALHSHLTQTHRYAETDQDIYNQRKGRAEAVLCCVCVVWCRCLSWLVGGPVVSPLQWVMLLADEAHKAIQQAATQTTTHGTSHTPSIRLL